MVSKVTKSAAELPAVLSETVLSPKAAARLLDTTTRSIARWVTTGCPVDGTVVRLDGVFVGTRLRTSKEAVARFLTACLEARTQPPPTVLPSPAKQRRQSREDREALKKMGVKLGP